MSILLAETQDGFRIESHDLQSLERLKRFIENHQLGSQVCVEISGDKPVLTCASAAGAINNRAPRLIRSALVARIHSLGEAPVKDEEATFFHAIPQDL